MSDYIICDECKKQIAEEKYIDVQGDHLKPVLSDGNAPWTKFARQKAIYDAIKYLEYRPQFFDSKYIGIKNYDRFGDQREDHDLGMGPKHGSIVFRILLKEKFRNGKLADIQRDIAIKHLHELLRQTIEVQGWGINL